VSAIEGATRIIWLLGQPLKASEILDELMKRRWRSRRRGLRLRRSAPISSTLVSEAFLPRQMAGIDMHGEFSPLGALLLVVWLAVAGFAVITFFRQPHPGIWHWSSLIVGVGMVGIGTVFLALAVWGLMAMRR
jgi:hypothetical protein